MAIIYWVCIKIERYDQSDNLEVPHIDSRKISVAMDTTGKF